MKTWGWILVVIGAIAAVTAIFMDVSVGGSNPFERINNMGLMDERRNILSIGETFFLAGIVLLGFGSLSPNNHKAEENRIIDPMKIPTEKSDIPANLMVQK